MADRQRFQPIASSFLESRANYWPVGIVCVLSIGALFWLISSWYPDNVRDFVIPNSFLPLILIVFTFFMSVFFLMSLHKRRAIMWSICLTILSWLLLQNVFSWLVLLYVCSPFFLSELALTVGKKK